MFVNMKSILMKAYNEHYAVAAPNVNNEHDARSAIESAEELQSPIILNVGYPSNPNIRYFGRILEDLAIRSKVPVAVNLDHGGDFREIIKAIQAGFSSVMVDRSMLPIEENIVQVKEIVRIAHAADISVEAELGHVGYDKQFDPNSSSTLTDPDEATRFVSETGVDCLAVAIGTVHGVYQGEPGIRFDILEDINEKLCIPLVLHGGSGSGENNLRKATKMGISKVNLYNDLARSAITRLTDQDLTGNAVYYLYKYLSEGYKEKLKYYIKILGSEGKA
ncbi:MAG: class II fructose-bisphosphate aldolase [Anaerolineaceae bacterium]|jgi:fructose-bisphosphate aldolase class II